MTGGMGKQNVWNVGSEAESRRSRVKVDFAAQMKHGLPGDFHAIACRRAAGERGWIGFVPLH